MRKTLKEALASFKKKHDAAKRRAELEKPTNKIAEAIYKLQHKEK